MKSPSSSPTVRFVLCFMLIAALFTTATVKADQPPPPAPVEAQSGAGLLPAEEMESLRRFWQENPQRAGALSDHYTIAGTAFQPRTSAVRLNYYAGGCVYGSGSASGESGAFTAPVALQEGSTILGVRFYGFDSHETADMQLALYSYTGAGAEVAGLTLSTSGVPAAFSQYAALAAPITVNNEIEALSMVWDPAYKGTLLRLCAAQILYVPPDPPYFSGSLSAPASASASAPSPASASMTRYYYTFIAGQDFLPRDAAKPYAYGGFGCINASVENWVVSDLDVPHGATLIGARLYYNDTSAAAGLSFNISTFDGKGGSAVLLNATNGTASTGYDDLYQALTAPYIVDQEKESLVISTLLPGSAGVAFCGARLYWSLPDYAAAQPSAAEPAPPQPEPDLPEAMSALNFYYRNIAGMAFQPRTASTTYAYDEAGCTHITGGTAILTADLRLPDGADLWGVRLFTYDTAGDASTAVDSTMLVTEYDNAGGNRDFIRGHSEGNAGYGELFYFPDQPHIVNSARSLSLIWNANTVTNSTMRLCGMRVYYNYSGVGGRVYLPMLMR